MLLFHLIFRGTITGSASMAKNPTFSKASMKAAAAARRAKGREHEKGGGGGRERVVERHRVFLPVNCTGQL